MLAERSPGEIGDFSVIRAVPGREVGRLSDVDRAHLVSQIKGMGGIERAGHERFGGGHAHLGAGQRHDKREARRR